MHPLLSHGNAIIGVHLSIWLVQSREVGVRFPNVLALCYELNSIESICAAAVIIVRLSCVKSSIIMSLSTDTLTT